MPMVKRHLQHIFGRLQRRLTLSYLLVTLLAALALFGHTVWLNAQYMFRVRIAEGYAGTFFSKAEPELLTLFNGSLPDLKGLETWVTRYADVAPTAPPSPNEWHRPHSTCRIRWVQRQR